MTTIWDFDPTAIATAAGKATGQTLTGAAGGWNFNVGTWTYRAANGLIPAHIAANGATVASCQLGSASNVAFPVPSTTHLVVSSQFAAEVGGAQPYCFKQILGSGAAYVALAATEGLDWHPYFEINGSEDIATHCFAPGDRQLISIVRKSTGVELYVNGLLVRTMPALAATTTAGVYLVNDAEAAMEISFYRAFEVDNAATVADMQALMTTYGITGNRQAALRVYAAGPDGGSPVTGLDVVDASGDVTSFDVADPRPMAAAGPAASDVEVYAVNAIGRSVPLRLTV